MRTRRMSRVGRWRCRSRCCAPPGLASWHEEEEEGSRKEVEVRQLQHIRSPSMEAEYARRVGGVAKPLKFGVGDVRAQATSYCPTRP
jgi:hypothetical protein